VHDRAHPFASRLGDEPPDLPSRRADVAHRLRARRAMAQLASVAEARGDGGEEVVGVVTDTARAGARSDVDETKA
jgi:hypothetical protein